ncbi:MAG: SDR family NAD(P)-dependent oxidoreductase [Rhodocyclaceae bacterium]
MNLTHRIAARGPDPVLALTGRHAVVTGGGSGIGAAIARELAGLGATLTLLGRHRDPLESVRSELPGQGHGVAVADVTDHGGVAAALSAAAGLRGSVAILVNNAGAARSAPAARTSEALWAEMIAVNLTGTFNCTRAVLEGMQAAGWGRVVNVASTAGLIGYAYVSAYCAAKHGVVGYTRALAREVAQQGITVNAVCPGYTDTPLLDDAVATIATRTGLDTDAARARLAASNPQGRLLQPEDVASTVGWLCLPGSGAIHGQAIPVAGGEVMAG